MEIGLIFLLMMGVMGIGYILGLWHDAPDRELRAVMLEQRLERMQDYYRRREGRRGL